MAKSIYSLEQAPIDILTAIKRALLQKGFVGHHGVAATDQQTSPPIQQSKAVKVEKPNPDTTIEESPDEDPEKLLDITTNAQDVLFEASTVFPFTLFPDTVTVDREKVTIANRFFFRTAMINSTPITDIQSIEADVGPFFGTVKMTSKFFVNNQREIHFLWRDDVLRLQHLIQGYIIAHKREVDCNSLDKEQLVILLNDLGQGVTD